MKKTIFILLLLMGNFLFAQVTEQQVLKEAKAQKHQLQHRFARQCSHRQNSAELSANFPRFFEVHFAMKR